MFGIVIINSSGETLASAGVDNNHGDSALMGGFVCALQIFVKQISGNQVKSMRLGDSRMMMRQAGDRHVLTIHNADEKKADKQNKQVVDILSKNPDLVYTDGFIDIINKMITSDK